MIPAVSKKALLHAKNLLSALQKQRWPKEKLEEWRNEKIRAMIVHAYQHVPFHRKRLDQRGLKPDDIQCVADLSKLPLSTKTDMRDGYPQQVIAAGYTPDNCITIKTSGSTGNFLTILHAKEAFDYYQALGMRQYYELGYQPWHVRAYFRWEPMGYTYPFEKIGILRKVFVPALMEPERQLEILLRCKPHMISGYPSSLSRFVRSVAKEEIRRIRPRFIISNSEQLTPPVAQSIRDAFGCDVYDEYSMFEIYHMAFECEHHAFHIVNDNVVLECVDVHGNPVRAGEAGEIIVTGFMNKAMPFIRYRTGDYGILSDRLCPCGRTFPLLEKLIGRLDDHLVLPSKKLVGPIGVIAIFHGIDHIREFQVMQQDRDRLLIQIVARGPEKHDPIKREIIHAFHQTFPGEPLALTIVFVDQIKAGATGKKRAIVSNPELFRKADPQIAFG